MDMALTMKPLAEPDTHYLRSAQGWLELGNFVEANEELEKIAAPFRAHPDVLDVKFEIHARADKWDMAAEIGRSLVRIRPDKAEPMFPKVWTIPYNLACYCAQLGQLNECQEWFKRAMSIDENTVRRTAIDDPDMKPLWDSMIGMVWKRTE
jgi:tetratricopeptide (TPR) repeat protein